VTSHGRSIAWKIRTQVARRHLGEVAVLDRQDLVLDEGADLVLEGPRSAGVMKIHEKDPL
jgi:hypothetical protein